MGNERPEPYRLLFPMGIIFAGLGVLPWILLQAGYVLSPDPVFFHGRLMFFGFLGSFISGFLMTAAPKMSGTWPARRWEVCVASVLLGLQVVMAFVGWRRLSTFAMAGVFVFLLWFLIVRFAKRRQNPPPMFIFVPVGLMSALIGSFILLQEGPIDAAIALFAKRLVYDAFVLNLIVGLGSRLVPVLTRVHGALAPSESGAPRWIDHLPVLLVLNLSFPVEAFLSREAGFLLRLAILAYVVLTGYRVFAPRATNGFLGLGLRTASVTMVLPYFLLPFYPAWELHLLHLSYVGGFALLTVLVAVRVVLAHGGKSLDFELRSRPLAGIAGFVIVAAGVRSLVPLWGPEQTFMAAAIASVLWLAGLGLWWAKVGRQIEGIGATIYNGKE